MSPTLTDARQLAMSRHFGQLDAQGRHYYDAHLLPIADALSSFGDDYETLGLLHDIVEDTGTTLDKLRDLGYSEPLVSGIDSMSRRVLPDGRKEPYPDLIHRSAADRMGRRGKIVDNRWNILCNLALRQVDPLRADSLLNGRYLPARKVLLAADNLTGAQLQTIDRVLFAHLDRLNAQVAA